jgi:hypothetical protein
MDTFTQRVIYNHYKEPLVEYTRQDGTKFLTSPSLREQQMAARTRQAATFDAEHVRSGCRSHAWQPYDGVAPQTGCAPRWLDTHGWVVVALGYGSHRTRAFMQPLPDLPAAIDHPIYEPNPKRETDPFIAGGNRSYRSHYLHTSPMDLGVGAGIFFHTRHLSTYRDGGSWLIREATLVSSTRDDPPTPYFAWDSHCGVERVDVQVIAAVEWSNDPSRPNPGPDNSRPCIISQREPLVRCVDSGHLKRLRIVAIQGQFIAPLYQYVDVGPDQPGEPPNKKELDFIETLARHQREA